MKLDAVHFLKFLKINSQYSTLRDCYILELLMNNGGPNVSGHCMSPANLVTRNGSSSLPIINKSHDHSSYNLTCLGVGVSKSILKIMEILENQSTFVHDCALREDGERGSGKNTPSMC